MKVHILGGGIGGMSCALHLALLAKKKYLDEQIDIVIYEASDRLGGKSKSQLEEFPGEHGFRFFPNFYRCIVDTLSHVKITPEYASLHGLRPHCIGTVLDNIIDAPEGGITTDRLFVVPRALGVGGLPRTIHRMFEIFGLPLFEAAKFSGLLLRFLTSCRARQLAEYEHETVESFFFERHAMSEEFRTFLASLRALSAMRADRGSLRTLLLTATQMLVDFDGEYRALDGILPGPTDVMMLGPWAARLEQLGVRVETHTKLTGLKFQANAHGQASTLERLELEREGQPLTILPAKGDHVVLALPFERARPLFEASSKTSPLPAGIASALTIHQREDNLGDACEPMVGVQFFLKKQSTLPRGHVLYCKSEWSMTSIAQGQFWNQTFSAPLAERFDRPGLVDVVSAIISAWEIPGGNGKAPKDSTEAEICAEALRQINRGLGPERRIAEEDVLHARVDRDVSFGPSGAFCPTPLWASPATSYLHRSSPDPGCTNFFIASDWARTETDVGSMESADEAARWAVRALASRSPLPPPLHALPQIRKMRVWQVLEALAKIDEVLFEYGRPHLLDVPPLFRATLQKFAESVLRLTDDEKSLRQITPEPIDDERLEILRQAVDGLDAIGYDPTQEPTQEQVERLASVLAECAAAVELSPPQTIGEPAARRPSGEPPTSGDAGRR